MIFFFKQKTAYEMRISDWSSDVCSSDLIRTAATLVVQSAFLSAGQRCTNARRLIVKQSMAEPLIEEVRSLTGRLIVDHPHADPRSEERRVGKACVSTCRSRWSRYP